MNDICARQNRWAVNSKRPRKTGAFMRFAGNEQGQGRRKKEPLLWMMKGTGGARMAAPIPPPRRRRSNALLFARIVV